MVLTYSMLENTYGKAKEQGEMKINLTHVGVGTENRWRYRLTLEPTRNHGPQDGR